ncbi:protein ZNRD2 [Lepisosteus oculatus]|uniref:protein ZNRD2 n=1 Tax=Lepisosteus oculatus TaxID=7918 RepID=UPI0035F5301A
MALNAEDEDYEWEPPSEAEMKVIQARRERQDKISKLMGDYLLKGFKMLGECCDQCGTILLQDKQKKNYCVACQELDSDIDKDNPALNAQAALSQVRERQLAFQPSPQVNGTPPSDPAPPAAGQPRPVPGEGGASPGPRAPPLVQSAATAGPAHSALAGAEEALLQKLQWAARELQGSTCVEANIQLCGLIRSCADSLRSLKSLQS